MYNKNNRIDEFLKYFRDIVLQNPDYILTKNNVYGELVRLGVPQNERQDKISFYFSNWIEYFKNDKKCEVFVDPKWTYFCQFISKDSLAQSSFDHLKVYVPLDSNHIEKGAKEIFKFLSDQNISHVSKIGSDVRFDDIVIRLVKPSDVEKLIQFVNNNKYIKEGLLPANPFTYSVNGISVAIDGWISFNSTISSLITLYINEKKVNNLLNTVGVDDFYSYVQSYYNKAFLTAEGLDKLSNDFSPQKKLNNSQLVNYKNVLELIIKMGKDNFNFESYIAHYNSCSNPTINNYEIKQIENIKKINIYSIENNEIVKKTNKMLLEIIDVMMEKYGNQYSVLCAINNYYLSGSDTYITRYKNLRNIVTNSNFREELKAVLENKGVNVIEYAELLLSQRKNNDIVQKQPYSTIEKSVILTIREILEIMTEKFGINIARKNFAAFVNIGSPELLTRDFNLRNRILNSTFRMDLINILNERKMNLEDYLNIILEMSVEHSEVYLEQAILETYSKYEKNYIAGFSNIAGKDFVVKAIQNLVERGTYDGFTRDNGARERLQNNVSSLEVMDILKKSFNYEKFQELSNENFNVLLEEYVNTILMNNNIKKYK